MNLGKLLENNILRVVPEEEREEKIMKKRFFVFLAVIVLSLTACGGNKLTASNKAISCANEAIEIGEAYLSYDMNYDEAEELLNALQEDMSYVTEDSNIEDEHHIPDLGIYSAIQSLNISLITDNYNGTNKTYDEVQSAVETLKEKIEEYK